MANSKDELAKLVAKYSTPPDGPKNPVPEEKIYIALDHGPAVVFNPKRDPKTGYCVEPTEDTPARRQQEKHNRERWAHLQDYAGEDAGLQNTRDKTGKYNCGGCNQIMPARNDCWVIKIKSQFDPAKSSCRKWERHCKGDFEMNWHGSKNMITEEMSNFGTRKGGGPDEVFGCHNCPIGIKSKLGPDDLGNDLYCQEADARVGENDCCAINAAPTK